MDFEKDLVNNKQRNWLRRTLAWQMKSTFVIPAVGAGLMLGAATLPARADAMTYTVTDEASLISAINNANSNSGTDTINITSSFQFDNTNRIDIPMITDSVIINGKSSRRGRHRLRLSHHRTCGSASGGSHRFTQRVVSVG